jgi:hypothetical protein
MGDLMSTGLQGAACLFECNRARRYRRFRKD